LFAGKVFSCDDFDLVYTLQSSPPKKAPFRFRSVRGFSFYRVAGFASSNSDLPRVLTSSRNVFFILGRSRTVEQIPRQPFRLAIIPPCRLSCVNHFSIAGFQMRVLIACESSGRTRDAFLRRGHDAISCDLLPTEVKGPHYQGDVRDLLHNPRGYDLMIAHPDCTYLTGAAEWAYKDVQKKKIKPGTLIGAARRQARVEAIDFVLTLAAAPIPMIAIENPVGVLSREWRKPDQYIQPYEYGEDASKKTCLWLQGLPKLTPTQFIEPRWICCGERLDVELLGKYGCPNCHGERQPLPRWASQTDSGQNKETPSPDRWKDRSRTPIGWSEAFADQWG